LFTQEQLFMKNTLSSTQHEALLSLLAARFEKHRQRHEGLEWSKIKAKLEANPDKCWLLGQMEQTGGEPDVVAYDAKTDEYIFFDCSAESPAGRRGLCYDQEALDGRKENKPAGSALETAAAMGLEILTEDEYRQLQTLGNFDLKTSSWLKTPEQIRQHGGAIFGDRRYDHVFTYHNGASSYYAARGFRGSLRL
jgi:hypothetical protein